MLVLGAGPVVLLFPVLMALMWVLGAGPVVLLFPVLMVLMWILAEGVLTFTPIFVVESTDKIPGRSDSESNHSLLSGPPGQYLT